jgi:uncharacterized protein (DUF58 family)
MRFVFSRRFYLLLFLGLLPLSLSWGRPWLRWLTLGYDILLLLIAFLDYRISQWPRGIEIDREFDRRFAVGAQTEVRVRIANETRAPLNLRVKDEYPPSLILIGEREAQIRVEAHTVATLIYELKPPRRGKFVFGQTAVRYRSRLGLIWKDIRVGEPVTVKVYPNMNRAREAELKALGSRSLVTAHRKSSWRGEGREFESMRDYVLGDELRHISWTATARRGKLTTRQYQIERDQTILIALDGGRLMTGRVGNETKLDLAIHATLALMSAAARGGDNSGMLVFGRNVETFIPPKRGHEHIDAALEALHAVEPEMIEPSYTRACQYIATNCKRRALVVLLTDLVDEEGSQQLLKSLNLLRPRHLPLVVTIGDRDLKQVVSAVPRDAREIFTQSVAEEIIHLRESALRKVESIGGLALDVTASTLVPQLLETYIRVKERGML